MRVFMWLFSCSFLATVLIHELEGVTQSRFSLLTPNYSVLRQVCGGGFSQKRSDCFTLFAC